MQETKSQNMLFGYARISTENQKLDSQIDALILFGVEKRNIFADVDSGKKTDRKGLQDLLNKLRPGDQVVFYDLSRMGRNLKHLITVMEFFSNNEIDFKDLTNTAIDTKSMETPAGRLIFIVFASIAQFMREQSNEKVKAGLESARKQGRVGGRRPGPSKRMIKLAPAVVSMYKDDSYSNSDIMKAFGIAAASIYKCCDIENFDYRKFHKNRGNNNRNKNTKIVLNKQ